MSDLLGASVVTYSPAYTLVPTYECFNRCQYCNFRTDPGQSPWITLEAAQSSLESLRSQGIIEVLILSGEVHPHSPQRSQWFQNIYSLCQLALDLGFLPHTNVGPLSYAEMAQLRTVNVSMGLMLEQLTPALLQTVHRHAPSKVPQVRLQQLQWAGELKIPFTTGLLFGIGENDHDRLETLDAIAAIHTQYGHIQEVILQPHQPGSDQAEWYAPFFTEDLIHWIQIARDRLPTGITLQIPPNLLTNSQLLIAAIEAGARDLGGIGPRDEVNPHYPHCHPASLATQLQAAGWQLQTRLPVYPQYDGWLDESLRSRVQEFRQRIASRRA